MKKFLFDSDVIIWYLKGRPEEKALIKALAKDGRLCMSVITITEIRAGLTKNAPDIIKSLKEIFIPISINEEISEIAGDFKQKYNLGIADMLIASCAVYTGSALVTYNKKHFPMKEVHFYK